MKKQPYQTPEMEITRFDAEDIIRTSGGTGPIPGDHKTEIIPDALLQDEDYMRSAGFLD